MAIEDDVLVIGGGVAGVAAALAAREHGDRVRLLSHKESTLRHASGLVDVLGYVDGQLVAEPLTALNRLPEDHPYQVVGREAVEAGLALFDDAVGDCYAGAHINRNALVPTHGGTVKPTARYPASVEAGLASDRRDALLVGFETLPDLDAPLAAAHLSNAGVPFETRGVTVQFPGNLRADATVTRYAHLLDRDDNVGERLGARAALAETAKEHLHGEERVGFPAVLGDDQAGEVRAELSDALGADVFEVPMGPPSLPGLRLADQLYDALQAAGVRVATGNPVVDFDTDGDRVKRVYVDRTGQRTPYTADQFVLATGGLVGKGIDTDRERVREPVFDLHVPHPADRYDWFADDAFGNHPFARFGVVVDEACRPLDDSGDRAYRNLQAAGGVVGGADFAAEKCGSGVSLATGYVAGTRAGELA